MNAPALQSNLWTERYEALRRHFMENRPLLTADPLGLSLLFHRGLAGWMGAWQPRAATVTPPAATSSGEIWKPPVTPVWQQDLTRLIAQMTAQHLQPIGLK